MADERVQSVRMTQPLYDRIAAYADDNSMSVSEVIVEMMRTYARGEVAPPERHRRSRRVSIWIDPTEYIQFTNRAQHDGVSITDAVEKALEESL